MSVFQIVTTAFDAISPIVLLTLFGYLLKCRGFLTKEFAAVGNAFVFRFCIPAMLFLNICDIESMRDVNWQLTIYCLLAACFIFVLGYVTSVLTTRIPERRGVLLQCSFRSNFAIIGLPLANMLGGSASVGVAAVISAASIPVFNILAVISLSIFVSSQENTEGKIKSILINIMKNPLIQGVALGLVCLGMRELQIFYFRNVMFSLREDLSLLHTFLSQLKAITTPLSLIILGAQFEFSAVRTLLKEIVVGTLSRTVVAPLIGVGLAVLLAGQGYLQCGSAEIPALVALFGSPVAVSSAIMASSMKNDGQLAAQLVVWTSIASVFTLFVEICILLYFGLIG